MPDLDNMAKDVKGIWKQAVHAGIRAPQKIGQVLAYVLSRCAVKMAGEGSLPAFQERLTALAGLPLVQREQAFRHMHFPISPEGKDVAAKAARKVGRLICAGRVTVEGVARVLAREFLMTVPKTEFLDRLTEPDMVKIFGSVDAGRVRVMEARGELEAYIDGTVPEFAESMFRSVREVEKPDLPKLSTEQQMEQDVDVFDVDFPGNDED
jgi:hypothetical protein